MWERPNFVGWFESYDTPYHGMCHDLPDAIDGTIRPVASIQMGSGISVCLLYLLHGCKGDPSAPGPKARITDTKLSIRYSDNVQNVGSVRCFKKRDDTTGRY